MKRHRISGGRGTQLHVIEAGNPRGKPILFIHGLSQCSLAWSRQLDSELARDFRLVAMDLRGHGLSDKPREGYDDSKLWADAEGWSSGSCFPLVGCGDASADPRKHPAAADARGMRM